MIGTQRDTGTAWLTRTEPVLSQALRIWVPRDADGVTARPLVIWSHPQGANEQIAPGYFAYPLVHAWVNAGYLVVASNNHGIDSWTSANAESDLLNAYTYVNSNINPVSKVALVGASMGAGVSAIAVANASVPTLKGAALLDPAVNLSVMYANATYTASITTGFGITAGTLSGAMASTGLTSVPTTASFPTIGTVLRIGNTTANVEDVTTTGASNGTSVAVTATAFTHLSGAQVSNYPTKALNRDPVLRTAASYNGKRWLIISGASDVTAPPAANANVLTALINTGSPTEMTALTHPGAHLPNAVSMPRTTLAFLARCFA